MEIRKYFFYTIVLFLSTIARGQNQNYIDSLVSVYESSNDTQIKLQVLSELCSEQSGADKRIEFAGVLLELAEKNREFTYTHYANLQLGIGHRLKGDLPSSLNYLLTSAKIADQLEDEKLKGQSFGEISTTYASQGDTKNSVIYMNKAIAIFRKSEDKKNLVVALMNTGYDYYTINQYDSSLLYYNEAESIVPSLNETEKRKNSLLAYIRGNRGITWLAIDKDNEAITEISNSIEYLRSIDDEYAVADFLIFLGKAYIKSGEKIKAKEAALEASEISKKLNIKEQQRDASFLLYQIAFDEGNTNDALSRYQQYIGFRDSIENNNVIRQMTEQRAAYEIGLKQKEVDLLAAQKRIQTIVLIGGAIILLFAIISAFIVYGYYKQKNKLYTILEQQKQELERVSKTKDKFFSIISHDMRGPIHAFHGISRIIKFLVTTKNTDELISLSYEIDKSVDKITMLLDNLLSWAVQQQGQIPFNPKKLHLNPILNNLKDTFNYIAQAKDITINLQLEHNFFIHADKNMAETIFRNILSNGIKFTPDRGKINIKCSRLDNLVSIEFQDSGVGMKESQLNSLFEITEKKSTFGTQGEKGLGIGLALVKEFTERNRGRLQIDSKPKEGTTITVSFKGEVAEKIKEKI